MLDHTIKMGGSEFGGVMPGFGATLDEAQRVAIIAYVQSWWPDDIYARWEQIDARSQ